MKADSSNTTSEKQKKDPYVYSSRLLFLFIFAPSIITLVLGLFMTGNELDKALVLMSLSFLMSIVAGAFSCGLLMKSRQKISPIRDSFVGLGYFIAATLGAGAISFGGCLMAISV